MPIYEYECDACGHKLEKLRKISDEPFVDCPQCQKPKLRKLVSAAAFRLKGSGWYETDFKTGKKKNVTVSASDGGSSDNRSSTSSDSKSSDSKNSNSSTSSS